MSDDFLRLIHDVAIYFPAFLLVFTVRGCFKALMASLHGDNTGRQSGFLTLNPLAHVNVYGLLIFFLVLFLIGGLLPGAIPRAILLLFLIAMSVQWTFPVPIDPRNFKHLTQGMIFTLLAGPMGTFALALVGMYVGKYVPFGSMPPQAAIACVQMVSKLIEVSLVFGVIDLVPLPPFDGGYLLAFLAPESWRRGINFLEEYSYLIFISCIILPGVSDVFFTGIFTVVRTVERLLSLMVI